jgi:hypothetical protein
MKHPAPPIGTLQPDRLLRLEAGLDVTASSTSAKKTRATKTRSSKLRIACGVRVQPHSNNHRNSTTQFGSPRAAFFFCLFALPADRSSSRFPTGRRLLKLASPGEPSACISQTRVRIPHGSAVMARPVARPSPSPSPPTVLSIRTGCGDSSRSNSNNNKTPRWHSLHQQRHTHLPRQQSACPLRVWLVDPIASPATPSPASPLSLDYRIVQRPPGCLSISRRRASGSRFPAMPTEKR